MAGDWIKWEHGLEVKAEVFRMAKALGISRHELCGRCMVFWAWADVNTADGFIPGADADSIDEIAGAPGFASAMERVGWLVVDDLGATIINFDRHNGRSAKERAMKNRRQAGWRSRERRVA